MGNRHIVRLERKAKKWETIAAYYVNPDRAIQDLDKHMELRMNATPYHETQYEDRILRYYESGDERFRAVISNAMFYTPSH